MLISYPILTLDASLGDLDHDTQYSDHWFPDPPYGSGAYPLSAHLRWHGGIHLRYGSEPIRSIADGKIVFARAGKKKNNNEKDPLNYGSADGGVPTWTDNGCLVIEHSAETGKDTRLTFWSVYMHLSTVKTTLGDQVSRKDVLGQGGEIAGDPSIHFEIFTNQQGVDALIKRVDQPYKIFKATDNSGDPDLWGDMHFVMPAGTEIFDQTPTQAKHKHDEWKKRKAKHDQAEHKRIQALLRQARQAHKHLDPSASQAQPFPEAEPPTTGTSVGKTDKNLCLSVRFSKGGCKASTFEENGKAVDSADNPDSEYEYNMHALAKSIAPTTASAAYELLRFGRVVGEDALVPADVENWQYVAYAPGSRGYVNFNASTIVKLSDADFPAFLGWQRVKEGATGTSTTADGRCDAKAILDLLDENGDGNVTEQEAQSRLRDDSVRRKMRRMVCEFRTEWEEANFDSTYNFLLKDGTWGDNTPRAAMTQDQYSAFKAHATELQWWTAAALPLPSTLWHFHPIEFITWMRKCAWIDKTTLAKIYDSTPEDVRERYRVALNQVMQKYVITNPIRQAHFFGQGAVESSRLMEMQEASMAGNHKNPASVKSEAELGHWYGRDTGEFDSYFSSVKYNSHGGLIAGSYSWSNGNVGDIDAQEFRGRGFKQLTGRSNYAGYWVYRGWLKSTDFDDHWWDDPAYVHRTPSQMTRRPAPIDDPDRIIANPYNCMDSGGFYITFARPHVKPGIDKSTGKVPVSQADNAKEAAISDEVTYAINGAYKEKERRYDETIKALKVIN